MSFRHGEPPRRAYLEMQMIGSRCATLRPVVEDNEGLSQVLGQPEHIREGAFKVLGNMPDVRNRVVPVENGDGIAENPVLTAVENTLLKVG